MAADRRKQEMTLDGTEGYFDSRAPLGAVQVRTRLAQEAQRIEAELAALGAPPLGDRHAWERFEHRQEKKIQKNLKILLQTA